MEHDNKNKHRISDARWRDSVSRCYNLLRRCSCAEQDKTRMAILCLTLDQIKHYESRIEESGNLDQVQAIFGQSETYSLQLQQQMDQQVEQQQGASQQKVLAP